MSRHSHPVSSDLVFQGDVKRARELGYDFYKTGKPCPRGHRGYRRVTDMQCVQCSQEDSTRKGREYRERDPLRKRVQSSRYAAKLKGIPFDEKAYREVWEARPTHCPVFGIELDTVVGPQGESTPEMDQVIPGKGYVRGNMRVISKRANRIKNDGTAAEHRTIAAYMEKETKK